MLRSLLALVLFGVTPMFSQETVVSGRLIEMDVTPSIIHVKKVLYPALPVAEWAPEILVAENGSFHWSVGKLETPTLFELLSPPWSWMVLVRPDEQAVLEIRPGRQVASRLLGSPGFDPMGWRAPQHPNGLADGISKSGQQSNCGEPGASNLWHGNEGT